MTHPVTYMLTIEIPKMPWNDYCEIGREVDKALQVLIATGLGVKLEATHNPIVNGGETK